jgi:hypothetical protein
VAEKPVIAFIRLLLFGKHVNSGTYKSSGRFFIASGLQPGTTKI